MPHQPVRETSPHLSIFHHLLLGDRHFILQSTKRNPLCCPNTEGQDTYLILPRGLISNTSPSAKRLKSFISHLLLKKKTSTMPPQEYQPLPQTSHDDLNNQGRPCTCLSSSLGRTLKRGIYLLAVLLGISIVINCWLATRLYVLTGPSPVPSIGKRNFRNRQHYSGRPQKNRGAREKKEYERT